MIDASSHGLNFNFPFSHVGGTCRSYVTLPTLGEVEEKPEEGMPGDDFVITPAGLVRKENVHRVLPNQTVRRNEDGTYTIIPTEDLPEP